MEIYAEYLSEEITLVLALAGDGTMHLISFS